MGRLSRYVFLRFLSWSIWSSQINSTARQYGRTSPTSPDRDFIIRHSLSLGIRNNAGDRQVRCNSCQTISVLKWEQTVACFLFSNCKIRLTKQRKNTIFSLLRRSHQQRLVKYRWVNFGNIIIIVHQKQTVFWNNVPLIHSIIFTVLWKYTNPRYITINKEKQNRQKI